MSVIPSFFSYPHARAHTHSHFHYYYYYYYYTFLKFFILFSIVDSFSLSLSLSLSLPRTHTHLFYFLLPPLLPLHKFFFPNRKIPTVYGILRQRMRMTQSAGGARLGRVKSCCPKKQQQPRSRNWRKMVMGLAKMHRHTRTQPLRLPIRANLFLLATTVRILRPYPLLLRLAMKRSWPEQTETRGFQMVMLALTIPLIRYAILPRQTSPLRY